MKLGIFVFGLFVTSVIVNVAGQHEIGQRVPGSLTHYNKDIKIDGAPVEHWKFSEGDLAVFKCITNEEDFPVFVWRKDGKIITEDATTYQLINKGNSFLEIRGLTVASEGIYTCAVSSDFGVAKKEYHLCIIKNGEKSGCGRWWYNFSNSPRY